MRVLRVAITAGIACIVAAAPSSRASTSSTATTPKLKWFGINESGAEFGTAIPGTLGTDYTWYNQTSINTFISKGMNVFRINFLMERLTPTLTSSLDATYLAALKQNVEYATNKRAYAILCPHNYGRFNGAVITDTAGFKAWWKKVAAEFRSNKYVIFDTNNEYHDMSSSLVVSLNQAAIDGIRAAGATTQFITPEGNAYTGAWTWTTATGTDGVTNANSMGKLTDPKNRLIYQMHQYLDSDGSGTSDTCVSSTVGQERLVAATNWLRSNKKKAIIGEFAGGANAQCKEAINGMLSYMKSNTDVWKGAVWWAAGPWWGNYIYNMEPIGGIAYTYYLDDLLAHR